MGSNDCYFYSFVVLSVVILGTSLAPLIILSLHAHPSCNSTSYDEDSEGNIVKEFTKCPDTVQFECPYIFRTYITSTYADPIEIECPWHERDLGLALTALALALIYDIIIIVLRVRNSNAGNVDKCSNPLMIPFGAIVVVLLLAAAITLFVDLNAGDLPANTVEANVTTTYKRASLGPPVLIVVVCVFVFISTMVDCLFSLADRKVNSIRSKQVAIVSPHY